MSSEEQQEAGAPGQPGADALSRRRGGRRQVNDPGTMRALAHPLRWALLEELTHAGPLTATQASELLGETPANCAFHLRTLAKYGLVEEAAARAGPGPPGGGGQPAA